MQLDGFYLAYPSIKRNRHRPRAQTRSCVLLWALDAQTARPIWWKFYPQLENPGNWLDFVGELQQHGMMPRYVVHDGNTGLFRALSRYWPEVRHQRCLVHLMSNMHKDLGVAPRTAIARELKCLVAGLFKITDQCSWQMWREQWQHYCVIHQPVLAALRKREACFEVNVRVPRALLEAFTVINNAYLRDELVTFLEAPADIPRTTNAIESLNGNLRELLRRHRGLPLEKRMSLVGWYLALKQKQTKAQLFEHIHTF